MEHELTELYEAAAFYIFGIGAVAAGALMIFTRDMVRSALWLVAALGNVAALFVVLSADFLAVIQVLIYIGAVMVLILFAIMLTPGQIDMPALGRGQQIAAGGVAAALFGISISIILTHDWPLRPDPLNVSTVEALGVLLFSTYVLPLLLVAVLLTAVMIGALVVARED